MTPEERDLLAGELALGVLDGADRADALRLLIADRAFAAEVERWRERFSALFAAWPEVAPDPALEPRIMAALPGGAAGPVPIAQAGSARSAGLWRAVAAIATLAAACLLVALLLRPERVGSPILVPVPERAQPAPLLAALTPTEDEAAEELVAVAVLVNRETGEIRLATNVPVPAGRSIEMWTIAGDGVPRSLGLLGDRRLTVRADARARLAGGVTLAISIEPTGGSTTGTPTGPVIATGPLSGI